VRELRDYTEEDPREAEASKFGLNYVGLTGEIGCIVNGAGLAMATMDMIKLAGAEPANFLDVGGGASPERVAAAFKLVLSDPRVQVVLVNIFAGINRCDWIAQGVVQAARDLGVTAPIVARLAGTNVEEGRRILKESGLGVITADTLADAAAKAVDALRRLTGAYNGAASIPVRAAVSGANPLVSEESRGANPLVSEESRGANPLVSEESRL
jgi:malate-CoA ligase subunit beta